MSSKSNSMLDIADVGLGANHGKIGQFLKMMVISHLWQIERLILQRVLQNKN